VQVIEQDLRASAISSRAWALLLCAGSSLLEGFNNQTLGVAAPKLFPAFHLAAGQGSLLFSATTAGLAIGSVFGGRLADRYGRKPVLLISVALFGLCSLMTAVATTLPVLFIARLLTGLGTGGAMPNAMAISADAAPPRHRLTLVAMVTAALPLGGAIAGLLSLGIDAGWSWRSIFYAGGAPSVVLLLAMWWYLPNPSLLTGTIERPHAERPQTFSAALFGAGRALTTVELWIAFFFLHMILFMLLNWLPSLFIGLGFTHAQGSWSAFWFNLCGAIAGVLLARMQGGPSRERWSTLAYAGMGIALVALALSHSFFLAALAVALAGTFVIGGQLVLYAMAPFYYPPSVRATGAGAAVASGRIGSIAGPLFAGALLSSGGTSTTVLIGALPFVVLSGAAVLLLARRRYAD
jgi:AAHS family 3-hydroxyphenylpropionic acid transporter